MAITEYSECAVTVRGTYFLSGMNPYIHHFVCIIYTPTQSILVYLLVLFLYSLTVYMMVHFLNTAIIAFHKRPEFSHFKTPPGCERLGHFSSSPF
jgi:hypothetical protein